MESEKVMVNFNGIMAKYLKDNGKMELKMDMEPGNLQKVISTRVSGDWIDSMEKEYSGIGSVHIEVNLLIS